jgi:hypothetical protein
MRATRLFHVLRTIPLFVTTSHCERSAAITTRLFAATAVLLLSFAASATAKYSGGTGKPNNPYKFATDHELIYGNCDPNHWPPLAPPSEHCVFNEPISVQTKLVTVDVNVVDAQNKPISNAELLAYCEP